MKKFRVLLLLICICISVSSCTKKPTSFSSSYNAALEPVSEPTPQAKDFADYSFTSKTVKNIKVTTKQYQFKNSIFFIKKFEYDDNTNTQFYTHSVRMLGNTISIKYVDSKGKLITTTDTNNLPHKTLYIDTNKSHGVFGISGVYDLNRVNSSLNANPDFERPVLITHDDSGYNITYYFPKNNTVFSEMWAVTSDSPLILWTSSETALAVTNEFASYFGANRFRLSSDGFYQISYDSYEPTGPNNFFRNCANYVGSSFVKYDNLSPYFVDIAYATTKINDENQNNFGYIPTPSKSQWLNNSFNIGYNFYDTRFNADNATANLRAYEVYGDKSFLSYATRYSNFFTMYALFKNYPTDNGYLVQDYFSPASDSNTHASLNHNLANMNFLLELYSVTHRQKDLDVAKSMLNGIADTKNQWILPNNDLAYALHVNPVDKLEDYPYLTYNDLFHTKDLTTQMNIFNPAIDELMVSKKIWMDKNNITEYKKK